MNVLNLVTTPRPFFQQQCDILEKNEVSVTTISIPGRETQADNRSVTDYLRYYPTVVRNSLDGFDVIHANYGLTAPFAIAQPSRPIVLTLWGSDLMGKYKTVVNRCTKYFEKVILPSPAMAADLKTSYTLLPFGVDIDLFRPVEKEIARDKLGWENNEVVILFPYNSSRSVKRFELAKQIVDTVGDARLHVLSGVPYGQVPLYMNASDAVLITSERESGPMVAKEAALCNVPVVSTDVGFVPDVLADVKNSYVCGSKQELVDRLEYVLDSRLRSDGRKHAEEWMGDRLVNVYESVLEDQ